MTVDLTIQGMRDEEARGAMSDTPLSLTPTALDPAITGEIDPVDTPFLTGMQTTGLLTGAYKWLNTEAPDYDDFPENWTLDNYFERNQEDAKFVQPFLQDSKNPMNKQVIEMLGESYNDSMAKYAVGRLRSHLEMVKAWQDSPWWTGFGAVSGVGVDILATAASLLLTKTPGPGVSAMQSAQATWNIFRSGTGAAARFTAAGRVGTLGAVEGFTEQQVQALSDPFITNEDVWWNTLFGAVGGAGLGGAFPRAIGGFSSKYDQGIGAHVDAVRAELDELRDTVGAMGAPRTADEARAAAVKLEQQREVRQARAGGTLITGRIPFLKHSMRFLRNPKNWVADLGATARKEAAKGLEGSSRAFDFFSRLIRSSRVMEDEVGGTGAGRVKSVEDFYKRWDLIRGARMTEVEDEFNKLLDDLYGQEGKASRAWRRMRAESETAAAVKRKWSRVTQGQEAVRTMISRSDYEALSDEIAQLKAHNAAIDADPEKFAKIGVSKVDIKERIPATLRGMLSDEEIEKVIRHAEATAAKDDKFWAAFQEGMLEAKLIGPDDIIAGYRPQIWNVQKISKHADEFKAMLVEVFGVEPDPAWVNQFFKKLPEEQADGTLKVPEGELWEEGTSWADFAEKNPELAEEIFGAWAEGIARKLDDTAAEATAKAEAKLAAEHAKTFDELWTRWKDEIAADEAKIEKFQRWIDGGEENYKGTQSWGKRRAQLEGQINSAKLRIRDNNRKLIELDEAQQSIEDMSAVAGKYGSNARKSKTRKARRGFDAAVKREAAQQAKKWLDEAVDEVYRNITKGASSHRVRELAGDKFRVGGSRLLSRQIHLGEHRFTERARKFLNRDSSMIRDAYTQAVGARIALRQATTPLLEREGVDLTNEASDRAMFIEKAMEGYDRDLAKAHAAGDTKLASELAAAKTRAENAMQDMFDVYEGVIQQSVNKFRLTPVTEITTTATAMMSLGSMLVQQATDLAVVVMAGSKIGTGFTSLLRSRPIKKLFHEIAQDDAQTAALMMGMLNINNMRWRGLTGTTADDMFEPGMYVSSYQKVAREWGHVQAMATFGNYWNRMVRGAFGHDFIRQIKVDLAQWDSLKGYQKTFYNRMGMNETLAREMTELWGRAERRYGPPGNEKALSIPDREKWMLERPDLMAAFDDLVQAAGDEAVMAPGLMDMPWAARSNIGKLVYQFSSFMFTAGEKVIPRITQGMALDPKTPALYLAAFSGVVMGGLVDYVKHIYYGKDPDDWFDRPNSEIMWSAASRSPFLAGMSGTLFENAFTQFGGSINDMVGFHALPQAATKFKREQGIWSLLGATAGNVSDEVKMLARLSDDGDLEKYLERQARLIPLVNTIGIQAVVRAFQEGD